MVLHQHAVEGRVRKTNKQTKIKPTSVCPIGVKAIEGKEKIGRKWTKMFTPALLRKFGLLILTLCIF